jgi:hypothetical protein
MKFSVVSYMTLFNLAEVYRRLDERTDTVLTGSVVCCRTCNSEQHAPRLNHAVQHTVCMFSLLC